MVVRIHEAGIQRTVQRDAALCVRGDGECAHESGCDEVFLHETTPGQCIGDRIPVLTDDRAGCMTIRCDVYLPSFGFLIPEGATIIFRNLSRLNRML